MIKFSFTLPDWIARLLPRRLLDDLDQRSHLTGSASTSLAKGAITLRADRTQE